MEREFSYTNPSETSSEQEAREAEDSLTRLVERFGAERVRSMLDHVTAQESQGPESIKERPEISKLKELLASGKVDVYAQVRFNPSESLPEFPKPRPDFSGYVDGYSSDTMREFLRSDAKGMSTISRLLQPLMAMRMPPGTDGDRSIKIIDFPHFKELDKSVFAMSAPSTKVDNFGRVGNYMLVIALPDSDSTVIRAALAADTKTSLRETMLHLSPGLRESWPLPKEDLQRVEERIETNSFGVRRR